jgi:hypothetical protein
MICLGAIVAAALVSDGIRLERAYRVWKRGLSPQERAIADVADVAAHEVWRRHIREAAEHRDGRQANTAYWLGGGWRQQAVAPQSAGSAPTAAFGIPASPAQAGAGVPAQVGGVPTGWRRDGRSAERTGLQVRPLAAKRALQLAIRRA